MLKTISDADLTVTQTADGSTVTITGTSDKIQSNVFENTGLFDALRGVDNFQSATFTVNGTPVTGTLLPKDANGTNKPTTDTGLWANLTDANKQALQDGNKITYAITVTADGMSAQYNIILNIEADSTNDSTTPAA